MTLTRWLFSATLLSLSGALYAQLPETPRDYAWAAEITTPTASTPFWRIPLPDHVYMQSDSADLRDVRVFNQRGEAMPFALESDTVQQSQVQQFPLRFFQLHGQQNEKGEKLFTLDRDNRLRVLQVDQQQQIHSSWLLENTSGSEQALSRLKLSWVPLADNWEVRVSVSGSHDLNNWRLLRSNMPLMDLTSESGRLTLDTITLDGDQAYRYLLLSIKKEGAPAGLKLTAAQGLVETQRQQIPRLSLTPDVKVISSHVVEYRWEKPQPFSQITVHPANRNSVLPLLVEYRSARDGVWRVLTRQAFYAVGHRVSEPVSVSGMLIQSVRLTSESVSLNESPPVLTGERDRVTLAFNAQGGAPYLLSWGNPGAQSKALSMQTLIPAALREGSELHQLPLAQVGKPFEVRGEAHSATENAAQSASTTGWWSQGLLWGILIVGVVGLALLAFKVWRELRASR